MMKKVFALLITVVLILSLAACGNSGSDSNGENGSVNPTAAVTPTVKETAAATEFDYDAKAQELRELDLTAERRVVDEVVFA